MSKRKITEKMKASFVTMGVLLAWLIFGSSASILSPTNENLGILFGCLFSLTLILGPIYYVKYSGIKVKNPKSLFVEPSGWFATPVGILMAFLMWIIGILIISTPPFASIYSQLGEPTFIGSSATIMFFIIPLFMPITIFYVYKRMKFKRVIEYNSDEWKKLKSKK